MSDNPVSREAGDPVQESSGRGRTLALLVALSALVHLVLLLLPRTIRWDEPAYLLIGRSWLAGHGYSMTGTPDVHYPPLFPALFGAAWKVLGDPEWAVNLWFVLAGALLVLPVHALARRIFDARTATVAALLVAVFPGLTTAVLYWGTGTEPLFALLLYSAAVLAWRSVEAERPLRTLAAGVLLGAAYLGRPEGFGWLASTAGAMVVVRYFDRTLWTRRAAAGLAALVFGFAVLAAPYVAYLHRQTGRWLLSGKLGITYEIGEAVLENDPALYDEITNSIDPATGEVRWSSEQRFKEQPSALVVDDTGQLGSRVGHNLLRLASRALVQPVLPIYLGLPLLAAWLGASWRPARWRSEVWLWATSLPVAAFLAYHVQQRFFAPAFPAVLIWVAAGTLTLGAWTARRLHADERRAAAVLVAAIVVGLGFAHATVVRDQVATLREGYRDAGRWIGAHSSPDAKVLAVELSVCAYADRDCLASPRAPVPQLVDFARRHGGTHLVVAEIEAREARPFLLALFDGESASPGLEKVFETTDRQGRTAVFRIAAEASSR